MPIVKTVKGDLLKLFKDGEFDAIVHGCNCFHTMGAGIAAQISKQFPVAFSQDVKHSKHGDRNKLGTFTTAWTAFGLIVNAYTQFYPGIEDQDVLNKSIKEVFAGLDSQIRFFIDKDVDKDNALVGIPRIGAGLAGGDWETIEGIINGASPRLSITVVEYDPKR
jgi:O-acetyl-ADP-ribose deacetylase (regulator of RNase III)